MKAVSCLPDDYEKYYSVNLQKDKKSALTVNVIAIIIAVVMVVPVCFFVPISALFNMEGETLNVVLRFLSLGLLSVAYLVLHEVVHGIAMKICGTKKVKYGFTGMYAFAGSEDYYDKKSYIFIALAPVVLWGIVLAIVNFFVPTEWFWVIYIIQIINISGAAGDYFVTVKFFGFPKDILIHDCGVEMSVYKKIN